MGLVQEWFALEIQRHPEALRALVGAAAHFVPAALRGPLVSQARAVREVFERPEDFLMGEPNAPKLKVGPFLLGMDPPAPRYLSEKPLLQAALDASLSKLPMIASCEAEQAAAALADELAARGRIDLASGYAEPVFTRTLARYFGVPLRGLRGECFDADDPTRVFALTIRALGGAIGSSHPAPFGLEGLATRVAPAFAQHLRGALRAHRDGSIGQWLQPWPAAAPPLSPADTVLGRLAAASEAFDDGDEGVVRSVAGMLSASAGFPKAFAHAFHELLRHGKLDETALSIADDDEARAIAYVKEALRFRPVFPMLVRHCPRTTALSTQHGRVAAGSNVAFFPLCAMFDARAVERPRQFIAGRPDEGYYLFGGGPRACIGQKLIVKMFVPLLRALLVHVPQVRIAQPGKFRYDGPGIDSYLLEFARGVAHEARNPTRPPIALQTRVPASALEPGA